MEKRIERCFTSGTGNGVSKEGYVEFIAALEKEVALIKEFIKHYKKMTASKMFSSRMYALNNWHNEYVIKCPDKDYFPYELANRVGFNSWGDIEVSIRIPMKFEAPTFGGGSTVNMNAVFKVEHNVRSMKEFMKMDIPEAVKKEVLLAAKDYFTERVREDRENNKSFVESQLRRLKVIAEETENISVQVEDKMAEINEINEFLKSL